MVDRHLGPVVALLCSLLAGMACAQQYEFEAAGNASVLGDSTPGQDGANLNFDWEIRFRIGILMGEPVVSLESRYEIIGGLVTIPRFDPIGEDYETFRYADLTSDQKELVQLYDMQVEVVFDTGTGRSVALLADAGYLGPQGQWSFNVPGSPDWDELFYEPSSPMIDGEPDYYTEDEAKAFYRSGLTPVAVSIQNLGIALTDLHWWYYDNTEPARYRALSRANDRLLDGLRISYGYWIDPRRDDPLLDGMFNVAMWLEMEQDFGGFDGEPTYDAEQWRAVVARAEERMERLMDFQPGEMLGDNHAPYRQARIDAMRIMAQFGNALYEFQPEGVDLDRLERGREPRFGGLYGMSQIDGTRWVVDADDGTPILELGTYDYLVDRSFVASELGQCIDNASVFDLRDPASGEVMQTIEIGRCGGFLTFAPDPEDEAVLRIVSVTVVERDELVDAHSDCGGYTHYHEREGLIFPVSDDYMPGPAVPFFEEYTRSGPTLCLTTD